MKLGSFSRMKCYRIFQTEQEMHFDLSKPQSLLQQSVREFCKREFPIQRVREMAATEHVVDDRIWGEFADQGWIGMHLPEDLGGLGLGIVELSVVMEELGRACVPSPLLATNWALSLLAAAAARTTTGPGDKGASEIASVIQVVIEGTSHVGLAVFEEQAPWCHHANELVTRVADDQTLSGVKQLVTHGDHAKWLVVTACHQGELCIARVPTGHTGVKLVATPGMDGTRQLYQCHFDRVPLKDIQILARGSTAVAALAYSEQVAAVMVCSEMLGLMQWMLETTVDYAKSRQQFDRVIGSYQAVQHKCADMLLLTESARSATWYSAWALEQAVPDASQAVSIAKIYTSDAIRDVANLAVQVHGGVGFTWEHDLHFYYKRAKADELLLGDATFHRERLAQMIFN